MSIRKFIGHLHTINSHRRLVRKGCFKIGLYWQGLTHDLSKYSPTEFWVGVKYWQGTQSPNNAERLDKGYSAAWMHHKGRNKHHFEYWNDYDKDRIKNHPIKNITMPNRYIAEMIMDRIAACKVYKGKEYTQSSPWEYYSRCHHDTLMTEETRQKLEMLLKMMADEGEQKLYQYIKNDFLKE